MSQPLAGKRVVVMGLGRFGGGIGVTRWLCRQGARVHVTDMAPAHELTTSLDSLSGLTFTHRLGGHDSTDLEGCDLLVVSPAVDKSKAAFFKEAVARGIPWSSEMNLFLERCRGKLVGITGSVGKSTTTAMIGTILDAAKKSSGWRNGQVWLGGNIGKSLLDDLPSIDSDDVVVLELSSFQLEDAAQIKKSPHIAVITNIRENHLDRHITMPSYAAAKANIFRFQSNADWAALPLDEDLSLLPKFDTAARRFGWGVDATGTRALLAPPGAPSESVAVRLSVPGRHNLANAAAAMAVSRILGVPDETAVGALATFTGLAHRLEFVREFGGVRYYNDSKATTPEAAVTSLVAFDAPIVALVGGSEKGSDYAILGRKLAERAKAVICMGQTRQKIGDAVLAARGNASRPPVEFAEDFDTALARARALANSGDVVLLSPACPSYDWFRNYEHRGDTFRQIVSRWA